MKRTLEITHAGETFKRQTRTAYTHVSLAREESGWFVLSWHKSERAAITRTRNVEASPYVLETAIVEVPESEREALLGKDEPKAPLTADLVGKPLTAKMEEALAILGQASAIEFAQNLYGCVATDESGADIDGCRRITLGTIEALIRRGLLEEFPHEEYAFVRCFRVVQVEDEAQAEEKAEAQADELDDEERQVRKMMERSPGSKVLGCRVLDRDGKALALIGPGIESRIRGRAKAGQVWKHKGCAIVLAQDLAATLAANPGSWFCPALGQAISADGSSLGRFEYAEELAEAGGPLAKVEDGSITGFRIVLAR